MAASLNPLLEGHLAPVVTLAANRGILIHPKTALRWCLHGRDGVRLPSVKCGGKRLTTAAALSWWLAMAQGSDPAPVSLCSLDVAESDKVLAGFGLPRKGGN